MIDELRARFPEAPIAFTNMPPIREFPAFTPLIQRTIGGLVELHGEALKREVAPGPMFSLITRFYTWRSGRTG
jgi:hypothetical protein